MGLVWKLHTSVWPFKLSFIAMSVVAMTFSYNSDQFFSSWRSGLNQAPSILHGPSIQLKRLGRVQPFHKPNLKPTDFSVNFGPCYHFLPSDFFAHPKHLSTPCYKHNNIIRICGVPGCHRGTW